MAEGAVSDVPISPVQKQKAPRKRAPGGKRAGGGAAKGLQQRAASTASAAVSCSDEVPELVDVKQELPDIQVRFQRLLRTLLYGCPSSRL